VALVLLGIMLAYFQSSNLLVNNLLVLNEVFGNSNSNISKCGGRQFQPTYSWLLGAL